MNFSPKKFLSAAAIAVAMSVGAAVPASAVVSFTSSAPSISSGETITFATDANPTSHAQIFINGSFQGASALGLIAFTPAPWEAFMPCETIDITFRVYSETADPGLVKLWTDSYDASLTIEWVGDNTVACNDTWGEGAPGAEDSGEPLAKTGSDASTVASLSGVAGVAALVVAAAVALRLRRAQR
jgi:hypothetical protein